MEQPERKRIRLKDFDYSQSGAYFVTICTKDRKPILSKIVGDGLRAVPQIELTCIGFEIEKSIDYINDNIANINVNKYIIMPNHINMIIILNAGWHGNQAGGDGTPPLQNIIARFKSYTTKRYNQIFDTQNMSLWQRSFYEHIIRNEQDYLEIWKYIDKNQNKWLEDKYYEKPYAQ